VGVDAGSNQPAAPTTEAKPRAQATATAPPPAAPAAQPQAAAAPAPKAAPQAAAPAQAATRKKSSAPASQVCGGQWCWAAQQHYHQDAVLAAQHAWLWHLNWPAFQPTSSAGFLHLNARGHSLCLQAAAATAPTPPCQPAASRHSHRGL
jgi:hypothetical protein